MKRLNIYIVAVLALFATSCNNFLDINPQAEVVNSDMFATSEGCEEALNGIYGDLDKTSLYGQAYHSLVFDMLAQDFGVPYQPQVPTLPVFKDIVKYDYEKDEAIKEHIKQMWFEPYKVISDANNIIESLEARVDNPHPQQNRYIGEAYGIRALMHFELVKVFAPHVENNPETEGIPYNTKHSHTSAAFVSVGKVYENIVADLKKAQELMIDGEFSPQYMHIQFNYYAATAYLARAYWMMGKYDEARTEALKVIDAEITIDGGGKLKPFTIEEASNIGTFLSGYLSKKETIFGVFSLGIHDMTKDIYGVSSFDSFRIYYNDPMAPPFIPQPLNSYNKEIYGNEEFLGTNYGQDRRLNNWFGLENVEPVPGVIIPTPFFAKTKNIYRIQNDMPEPGRTEGISLMRLSEMYYIVAEAYIRENNTAKAEEYINAVIENRGLTKLSERTPVIVPTIEMLYNERHKEFFGDGMRWFDMKKLNSNIISNFERKTFDTDLDKKYVFPIPQDEYLNRVD